MQSGLVFEFFSCVSTFEKLTIQVQLFRRAVSQRLVLAAVIVEREVVRQSFPRLVNVPVGMEIDMLVLHGPPQPLGKDVVKAPAARVHADPDVVVLQDGGVILACELYALIRIMNDRHIGEQRVLQGADAEIRFQRVRQPPGDDVAGEPIEDRGEVAEAVCEPDVRDIRSPNLVGALNRKTG